MESVIHILHLEDDVQDSQLAADLLREAGMKVEVKRVQTLKDFEAALADHGINLILSDYTVPGTSVLDALRISNQRRPELPFVFLSGTIREDLAIESLKSGATDYVLKDQIHRLAPAVRRALHEAEELAQRKRGEEVLAKTTARFNGIITSAMDAIISIDSSQRVVLFNPAAERMFGVPASQAVGRSINQFIPERFRASHTSDVEQFGNTGVSSRSMGLLGALSALRANGEEFPIEASISQVDVDGEKLFTVILRDITERKRGEEKLQRVRDELARANLDLEKRIQQRTAELVEANSNLQTFAYTAAHDLRAPLRSISNFSRIVVEDFGPQLGSEGQGLLGRVTAAANQMGRLLDALLEYSRISAAELILERVGLDWAVREALGLLEAEIKTRNGEVVVDGHLPAVTGHPASVVLLINNLLSNALKFVAADVRPKIRIVTEIRESWARLVVEDNGIGIQPKDLARLFGVFQRLQAQHAYPGTGLGLAIVRKAAERMGGRVGVESEPGKGSRFWVELKLAGDGDVLGPNDSGPAA